MDAFLGLRTRKRFSICTITGELFNEDHGIFNKSFPRNPENEKMEREREREKGKKKWRVREESSQ